MDVFWFVAQPWDYNGGAAVTVRATSCDLTKAVFIDGSANEFLPVIAEGPTFSTTVFDGAAVGGTPSTHGSIELTAQLGEIDQWAQYNWSSRPITIYQAYLDLTDPANPVFPANLAALTKIFEGEVVSYDADKASFDLQTTLPNGRVASAAYSGLGGTTGAANIKGNVKPFAAGVHKNRTPVLVDPAYQLYQFHAYGAVNGLTAVKERGITLDQPRVLHANSTSLLAATVPATEIHVCLSEGMFRLGFTPAGQITCDFEGHATGGYSPRLGVIIEQMLLLTGWPIGKIDQPSLDYLDAQVPHDVFVFDDSGTDVLDMIGQMLNPIGAYWDVDELGTFYVGLFRENATADFTVGTEGLGDYDLLDMDVMPTRAPFWKNRMGWGFNPTVFAASDLPGAGISTTRYPDAPPSNPAEGSIYIDQTGRQYRFEGLVLKFAGDPVLFNGEAITTSGWVDIQDQAILTAQSTAADAATAAAAANAELANIASDGILSPVEKPVVVRDVNVILNEQAGLTSQASALLITTELTTYTNAISALNTYLATLLLPGRWDDLNSSTTIVGATFRSKFADVYTARTALLAKMDDANKALANSAQASADTANSKIAEIASDSLLTPGEKPAIKLEYDTIIAEQTGLSAQALAFGITTERTAYNNAVSALTTYLATLTSPVLWSNVSGNTTIVAATFQAKFQDVYTTRTALLVKIDAVTLSQPVLSRLSATTGNALTSFISSNGLSFAQIARVGEARDGDAVSFGGSLPSVPKIIFLPGGNAATAGQNIAIQDIGTSVSGFTMKAKSQTVSAGATVTDTGATAGSGGEPQLVINRSSGSNPYDGRFVFNMSVTVGNIGPGEPGYIEIGIYVKQGGSWINVASVTRNATGTFNYAVTPGTVDFAAGNEFGVSVLAQEGTGTNLSNFNSVAYTPGTVTETSLTPTGASPITWLALLQ